MTETKEEIQNGTNDNTIVPAITPTIAPRKIYWIDNKSNNNYNKKRIMLTLYLIKVDELEITNRNNIKWYRTMAKITTTYINNNWNKHIVNTTTIINNNR